MGIPNGELWSIFTSTFFLYLKESNDLETNIPASCVNTGDAGTFLLAPCALHPHLNGEGHQKIKSTKNKKYGVHSVMKYCMCAFKTSNLQTSLEQDGFWHKYDRYQATVLWALRTQRWIKQFVQPVPIVLEHNMSSQLRAEPVDLPTKARCHVPCFRHHPT